MTIIRSQTDVTKVTPIRVQDITGRLEEVLYTVGWARNAGVLVDAGNTADHGDGTVTVQVRHTHPVPLALPESMDVVRAGVYRDWMDYVELGLRVAPWIVGAGFVAGTWVAVSHLLEWVHIHSVQVTAGATGGVGIAVLLGLLLLLRGGGGGGCAGLHCGGCGS